MNPKKEAPYYVWRRGDGYVGCTRYDITARSHASSPMDTFTTLLITGDLGQARTLIEQEREKVLRTDSRHMHKHSDGTQHRHYCPGDSPEQVLIVTEHEHSTVSGRSSGPVMDWTPVAGASIGAEPPGGWQE